MTKISQLPPAFLAEMKEILGGEYEAYKDSFWESWKPGLRINQLKISAEQFKELAPWDLTQIPWISNGFYYTEEGEGRPSRHPFYHAGLYYLQEPSAMTPAAMLPVNPGDRVLDLCAAPGGKSTELAARLKGRGLLVSNDISYSRARGLLKNLELTGAANFCVLSAKPEELAGIWPEYFDKILVDAPCSGEGMFRRDEAMVKDWLNRGPSYYAPLQRQILSQAVAMLKPGGNLLYSTCTFSRLENEENVNYILSRYPQMELAPLDRKKVPGSVDGIGCPGCMRLFPHRVRGEGHFLALFSKKGTAEGAQDSPGALAAGKKGGLEKEPELHAFLKACCVDWDERRIEISGEHVYYLPEGMEKKPSLRFLRTGLWLGTLKKGRFEPSQALAMALKEDGFPQILRLSVSDERVIRYLKGETIGLLPEEGGKKGWLLVTCEGFSLGWAKGSGSNLKNKYYPGWRWQ